MDSVGIVGIADFELVAATHDSARIERFARLDDDLVQGFVHDFVHDFVRDFVQDLVDDLVDGSLDDAIDFVAKFERVAMVVRSLALNSMESIELSVLAERLGMVAMV